MITLDCPQGSLEWFNARLGRPTASNFDKIITTSREPSKQREKYMRQLAAERVTGKLEESYKNECMDRGKQMEAEAVNLYEMLTTEKIQEVGVCYPDEKKICSCSPDRLVGEEGLLEIKCPISTTHVEYLLANKLPIEYVQQVQGQLYVTGRKWCDFMSYYPSIKPMIVRVLRSEIFINALAIEIEVFVKQLDEMTERIR